jgi:RNA polymerase sigma-70 factor (ECF subfamily)
MLPRRDAPPQLTLLPSAPVPGEPAARVVGQPLTLAWAYRQYAPYVARIGMRILGCSDQEIDDVVQDVFAEAVAGLQRLAHPAEVRGWLATVTVRVSSRRLKLRRVRRFFFLSDDLSSEPVCPAASPEQRALVRRVYRYLDKMPTRQRTAWVLRHVEEERLEDVATFCECSLATAKRLIAAAEDWLSRKVRDVPST